MKYNIKYLLVISALIIMGVSCSKKIDEAYANPNYDVKVSPEGLLPQIVASMAGNYGAHGPMNDIRYIGAYVQNFAYANTLSNFDRMGYTNTDVAQSFWRSHYYDIGQNNVKMIAWAIENKQWDYAGVGKAIFAWSWLNLTTYHGEVVLKEAFNTDQITFQYDKQEDVYAEVRKLSHEALSYLNKTGDNASQTSLAKGDAFFYKGDVSKWKKFVYGVLARSFNHLTNKADYKADSVLFYTNLAMKESTDDGLVKFTASLVSATNNMFGPFRANLGGASTVSPTAIRQGAFIANLMSGANSAFPGVTDPRAIYILRLNANNTFKGVEPNKGQAVLAANDRPENFWGVPQISANNTAPANDLNCRFIFRNDAPFPVMTATEISFMRAEAAFLKGDKATALVAYKDGIAKHFDLLMNYYNTNVPAASLLTAAIKASFLADSKVVPVNAADLTLSMIMLQKYIAMFGYGTFETWTDMRRYHYVDLDKTTGKQVFTDFVVPTGTGLFEDNGGKLVYRMRPRFNSEYVWNINELGRIGATQLDYHTKEQWFSQK
jgi:Starch-binding associating with outer membrane